MEMATKRQTAAEKAEAKRKAEEEARIAAEAEEEYVDFGDDEEDDEDPDFGDEEDDDAAIRDAMNARAADGVVEDPDAGDDRDDVLDFDNEEDDPVPHSVNPEHITQAPPPPELVEHETGDNLRANAPDDAGKPEPEHRGAAVAAPTTVAAPEPKGDIPTELRDAFKRVHGRLADAAAEDKKAGVAPADAGWRTPLQLAVPGATLRKLMEFGAPLEERPAATPAHFFPETGYAYRPR